MKLPLARRTVCALTPEQADRRGIVWIVGSFVLCPCHLPITLWLVAALLSGTAIGTLVLGHPYIAGVILLIGWLGGTLHGFNLMRRGRVEAYTRASGGFLSDRNELDR
jgi:mercuric ion transport protein